MNTQKKSDPKEALIIAAIALIIGIGWGCLNFYRPTPPAPSGTQSGTISACSNIDIGVVLYNRDGSTFGTVTGFSEKHLFPNGNIDRGVEVDGFWYMRNVIMNEKYVKK